MVVEEEGAPPHAVGFIVPSTEVEFIGNWDVIGLRSTGSVDYRLKDVFVPTEYTFALTSFEPLRGNGLFRASVEGATPFGHSAFAIGVGRRILTEIAALATASDGRTSGLAEGAGDIFQEGYGTVEGRLRAGRAFVYEIAQEVDATIARGDIVSTREISLTRLALNSVTEAANDVAMFAYRAAGGVALRDGVLQRNIRDMMAATQHRIVSSFMLRECARDLLGLAPGKVWSGGRLVDPLQPGRST
jgi:alkylation response protein AidB-like acyl-CoA dehydrogenase